MAAAVAVAAAVVEEIVAVVIVAAVVNGTHIMKTIGRTGHCVTSFDGHWSDAPRVVL